ncbi:MULTISPECIES: hypothetical protein [Bacillus]|uniref:Uncharacterized protein n=1 Tax=Bacillus velezensis TaxID=492670 RepID=A0ABC8D9R7_BACVE|nr:MULTISPECIES: hypothetical protein [Bacillus]ANB49341.1 hypothetical protein A1D33_018805 [Bacillus velezensis]AVI28929.1 hypothetical protein C3Z10_11315 [Bacillus velezensis]AWX72583.1 hypothetical protein BVDSYZ_11340 [Bacillus velezensis]KAF1274300.1 hypothetical protein BUE72_17260 [Bacillus amyloliquefaciens]MBR7816836.1 hypothetical protein [Bacillus sp. CCNWLCWHY013]
MRIENIFFSKALKLIQEFEKSKKEFEDHNKLIAGIQDILEKNIDYVSNRRIPKENIEQQFEKDLIDYFNNVKKDAIDNDFLIGTIHGIKATLAILHKNVEGIS